MTKKIIVAKTGYNAITETDPDNLVYSSEYDTLKYDVFGSYELSIDFSNYYDSIPASFPFPDRYYHKVTGEFSHNFGYKPYFSVYVLDLPSANESVQCPFNFADFGLYVNLEAYADANKIYFVYRALNAADSGTTTVDFNYRVFKNDLSI